MAMRQPENLPPLASALEDARKDSGRSQDDFWFEYRVRGGVMKNETFKHYLRGKTIPDVYEYDLMAAVLNDWLGEERLPRAPFQPPDGLRGRDSNPQPSGFKPSIAA